MSRHRLVYRPTDNCETIPGMPPFFKGMHKIPILENSENIVPLTETGMYSIFSL